jgi:hypothetical protein
LTLKQLLARREELLVECSRVDRAASKAREDDRPLSRRVSAGFEAHTELRVLEHELAKLKERSK